MSKSNFIKKNEFLIKFENDESCSINILSNLRRYTKYCDNKEAREAFAKFLNNTEVLSVKHKKDDIYKLEGNGESFKLYGENDSGMYVMQDYVEYLLERVELAEARANRAEKQLANVNDNVNYWFDRK